MYILQFLDHYAILQKIIGLEWCVRVSCLLGEKGTPFFHIGLYANSHVPISEKFCARCRGAPAPRTGRVFPGPIHTLAKKCMVFPRCSTTKKSPASTHANVSWSGGLLHAAISLHPRPSTTISSVRTGICAFKQQATAPLVLPGRFELPGSCLRGFHRISLAQQPFQSVDLFDPVVGRQRNEIHGNQVFRIVILDTFQWCKLPREGFSIGVIYSVRHLIVFFALVTYCDKSFWMTAPPASRFASSCSAWTARA